MIHGEKDLMVSVGQASASGSLLRQYQAITSTTAIAKAATTETSQVCTYAVNKAVATLQAADALVCSLTATERHLYELHARAYLRRMEAIAVGAGHQITALLVRNER